MARNDNANLQPTVSKITAIIDTNSLTISMKKCTGASEAIYGLGIIGAAFYYIQHAATFWIGVLGLIKAVFWPAIVLYRVLELLRL